MLKNKDLPSETCQSILEGYSMREIAKKLMIWYNAVYYLVHRIAQTGPNQNRKRSGRPRCTTEEEDKYIRVSSLRNRCLTRPQLAASLNSTRKTPVSTSTVKRQLWDAGLLGNSFVQCLCSFAHLNLLFLLPSLRYGFFFATLPRKPASQMLGLANTTCHWNTGVMVADNGPLYAYVDIP
ncbi:unnamed protein product [Oncorhynchus mykiss]|uniref:Transposase Tc1-like domain-containing protein n=1 Tax=Oncorhynchus mykiss TaxID=8022 RepID=A0A060YE11_ONCMY|nr:unnamed protein product [Oncorhynchus mykiss]